MDIIEFTFFLSLPSQRLSEPDGLREVLPVISELNLPGKLAPQERLKMASGRLETKQWDKLS